MYGLDEEKSESKEKLYEVVNGFFANKMGIEGTIKFVDAYRMGKGDIRPVMIKLKHVDDKMKIFSNVSNLKGKTNTRKKLYFIQDDMTEEDAETRKQFQALLCENKERDEDKS